MIQPTWLVDILAGVMLATSIYCVTRLVAARFWGRALHRDVNLAHVAMGTAMAGMLVAALHTLPDGAWEVVFGALVLWFGASAARLVVRQGPRADTHHLSHNLTHMVMAGAMFYMFVETSGPSVAGASTAGAMSAMGGATGGAANLGGLTLLLVFILFASAVWHFDALTRYTTARRQPVPVGSTGDQGGGTVTASSFVAAASPPSALSAPGTVMTTEEAQAEQAHWLAPRLEMGCHIAMCVTMGYMLILLL